MSEMVLDCDLGNSSCKWRLSAAGREVDRGVARAASQFSELPVSQPLMRIRVASVAREEVFAQMMGRFSELGCVPEVATAQVSCAGVTNGYGRDYSKLGVDRWLAVIGAYKTVGGAALVLDAGSALTADAVDDKGVHLGGYILPGVHLMKDSLLTETGQVRFDAGQFDGGVGFGVNTREAVSAGVMAAQVGAAKVAIEEAGRQIPQGFAILVTGGAGMALMKYLPSTAQYMPDLVLDGLGWALP